MRSVKELRVKESDRIDAMAKGLRAAGVTVDERIGGPLRGLAGNVTGGSLLKALRWILDRHVVSGDGTGDKTRQYVWMMVAGYVIPHFERSDEKTARKSCGRTR
jgi:hypothetical protein